MKKQFITLDTQEGYRYYDSPWAKYIHIKGIEFSNCSDDFKLKSFYVTANGINIINITDMDFFNFSKVITKNDNEIYFDFEKLNMLRYIEDTGVFKIETYICYEGDCKNNCKIVQTAIIQSRLLSRNWYNINEFYFLTSNEYKNNDIIKINTVNSLMNGIVVSGINYDNINFINVKNNTNQKDKYYFSNTYYKNEWKNLLNYTFYKLDDNTIYIPFSKYKNMSDSPEWNSDACNGKLIMDIELQFDLDDDDKLLNTYDLKFGMYVYNKLIENTKEYVRDMAINKLSNTLKED
jgi:hypothetical protein